MIRSRLILGVAAVLAGTTVVLVVLGAAYNPVLVVAALPFALATFFLWSHVTGRLDGRMRRRARREAAFGPDEAEARRSSRGSGRSESRSRASTRAPPGRTEDPAPARRRAARVLGVEPDADDATVRRAFREKARELHPDAAGGDEAAFKRAREAYETLRSGR